MLDSALCKGDDLLRSLHGPVIEDHFVTTTQDQPLGCNAGKDPLEEYLNWCGSVMKKIQTTMVPDIGPQRDYFMSALAYVIARLHAITRSEVVWHMYCARNAVIVIANAGNNDIDLKTMSALDDSVYRHIRVGVEKTREEQRALIVMTNEGTPQDNTLLL